MRRDTLGGGTYATDRDGTLLSSRDTWFLRRLSRKLVPIPPCNAPWDALAARSSQTRSVTLTRGSCGSASGCSTPHHMRTTPCEGMRCQRSTTPTPAREPRADPTHCHTIASCHFHRRHPAPEPTHVSGRVTFTTRPKLGRSSRTARRWRASTRTSPGRQTATFPSGLAAAGTGGVLQAPTM